jgi:hypothetical protein
MDNIQLQLILEEAYENTFLDRMEFIFEKESEYIKSEFFKKTKISLLDLYEKFESYKTKKLDIIDEFNSFIERLDMDLVVSKISEFLEQAEKDKKIVDVLNDLMDNFSVDKISEYATQIQEELTKVKE